MNFFKCQKRSSKSALTYGINFTMISTGFVWNVVTKLSLLTAAAVHFKGENICLISHF